MLGNISPKYRSRVNSIQLLAVVKTKDLKSYSMNAVLSPIIADIVKLVSTKIIITCTCMLFIKMLICTCKEKGFKFTINGCPKLYYGTISTICADNLGQSVFAGFKEGSTAYRGCRQCMAKKKEIKSVVSYRIILSFACIILFL